MSITGPNQYIRHQSIKSSKSPMKQLVKREIRRQSQLLVENLTVLERHSILIHPQNQCDFIKRKVKYDRKSILSNSKMTPPSKTSSCNSRSSFIDDVRIQEKIVRGSINFIVPKGTWYPNQTLNSRFSAKFSGSPQPKKVSGINFGQFQGPGAP